MYELHSHTLKYVKQINFFFLFHEVKAIHLHCWLLPIHTYRAVLEPPENCLHQFIQNTQKQQSFMFIIFIKRLQDLPKENRTY